MPYSILQHHLILTTTPLGRPNYYHTHFIGEETKASSQQAKHSDNWGRGSSSHLHKCVCEAALHRGLKRKEIWVWVWPATHLLCNLRQDA